jgi:hypothetical protein
VVGVSEAPVLHLLGEGRSILPSSSEVVWSSSADTPVMARSGNGGSPWPEPMTMASEPSPMGERLPKRMVSLREKPQHNKSSPSTTMVSVDDGTIRTSRGKARCKSPYLARELSVFFASTRTRWSRSCVRVLRWSCELQSIL